MGISRTQVKFESGFIRKEWFSEVVPPFVIKFFGEGEGPQEGGGTKEVERIQETAGSSIECEKSFKKKVRN